MIYILNRMNKQCVICYNEYKNTDILKYKCTTCPQVICNNCYYNYIKTNSKCMFCRGELYNSTIYIVSYPQEQHEEAEQMNIIVNKQTLLYWAICVVFSIFMLQGMIISSFIAKKNRVQHNITIID